MKNKTSKIIIFSIFIGVLFGMQVFAGKLNPDIPIVPPGTLSLNNDGTASFVPAPYDEKYKRFDLQLLKRVSVIDPTLGTIYTYKTSGSIKYCKADETEVELKFPAVGYYQFQIRAENLEGDYSNWSKMSDAYGGEMYYPGLAITEDDISIGGGGESGSGGGSSTGPGIVQTGTIPYGSQYAVIGPNGEILYYFGGNQTNYGNNATWGQYAQSGANQFYGPGYTNNNPGAGSTLYPNTGISNYPQVVMPNGQYNNGQTYNANGNSAQTNPNYSNGTSGNIYSPSNNTSGVTPQITQGMEIGWHVDNNGRFYYQGNGVVLRGTWYLIDGSYFRFGDNGYLLANQWYKDNSNGYWYFLAGDGRMLTGWQNLNGVWYYFKPENGNGYGSMYANTSLFINDPVWGSGYYAFDANGAMVKNAWYGGYYYGNDGRRTS